MISRAVERSSPQGIRHDHLDIRQIEIVRIPGRPPGFIEYLLRKTR
jgi:hypothetical protein